MQARRSSEARRQKLIVPDLQREAWPEESKKKLSYILPEYFN
jgi:hypothetical protein